MYRNAPKPNSFLSPKIAAALFLAVGIFAYGFYEASNFLRGPSLEVVSPSSGQTVHDPLVTVEGNARRIAVIYLNGKQVFTKGDGHFKESLLLARGYNIIEIKVKDQFGRTIVEPLGLVLD